jgi:hypothetical protein
MARLAPLAIAACSSSTRGTLEIVTGAETDTFSRSPAPSKLQVDAIDSSGNVSTLATVGLPASTIDLGNQNENTVATLEVSGLDEAGNKVVFGRSIPLEYGALDGLVVPIFVQRTGEMARLPGPLPYAPQAPVVSTVQAQYLFLSGGADPALASQTQFYDFAQLAPLSSPPQLPRPARSVVFVGPLALVIDEQGATYCDFSQNTQTPATAPAGGSFADVAGGLTIVSDTGVSYVVGGTRTSGGETASVLVLNPNDTTLPADPLGKLSWASLAAPRLGAAAVWATGRGLVVAGGSATAPGLEVLAPLPSMQGASLAYPPDASIGAGAAMLGPQNILLAGGLGPAAEDAGARTANLACAACSPAKWTSLPVPIGTAQAFVIDPANAIVVGSELSGKTHVFRLTSTSATEVPTKVPHTNARAAFSPVGTMVLAGGANELESFTP